MTSGVTSSEQTLHQLDVDSGNDLVRGRKARGSQRSEHAEAGEAGGLRRGNTGLGVLEDQHAGRVEAAVEELEGAEIAGGVRLPVADVLRSDDRPDVPGEARRLEHG